MSKALRQLAFISSVLLGLTSFAAAQITLFWSGNTGTNWFNAANWSGGFLNLNGTPFLIPNGTINAVIDTNGTIQPIYTGGASSGVANLTVGNTSASGSNTELIVKNGLTFANLTIGDGTGSEGMALVNGTFAQLTGNTFSLQKTTIGNSGNGTLVISNGGNFTGGNATIGNLAGSTGLASVDGSGSVWGLLGPFLNIGESGNGTLSITNGGNVSGNVILTDSISATLGMATGSSGTVIVSGSGSKWILPSGDFTTGVLTVGQSGNGNLSVTNGGNVSSGLGAIGNLSGSNGNVVVDGPGSIWSSSFRNLSEPNFIIGGSGNGSLTISSGGNLSTTNENGTIGSLAGSTGSVIVDGAGSIWNFNKTDSEAGLTVADAGNATLAISNGGSVSGLTSIIVGNQNGSNGTLTIFNGTISSIGTLSGLTSIILGNQAGSNGTLTISGASSLLNFATQNPTITVGANGNGVLNIEGGANLTAGINVGTSGTVNQTGGTVLAMAESSLFRGVYNLQGGTLIMANYNSFFGPGTLNLAGGTLQPGSPVFLEYSVNITLAANTTSSIENNTTLPPEFSSDDAVKYFGVLSGNGSLAKTGTGVWQLHATNTYTGETTITSGTLALSGAGSIATSSAINLAGGNLDVSALNVGGTFTIGASQALAGSGTVISSTTGNLAINGTLAPGVAGPLTVSGGNVALNGIANFTLNDPAHYSQLSAASSLTYGGNLSLNLGSALFNGIYNLFSFGSQSGDFLGVNLVGLFTGALADSAGVWTGTQSTEDFSFNDATGQLTVSDSFPPGTSATKQAWLQSNFSIAQLANTAVSGDNASPAGDGIPNFFKYAFNLSALTYGRAGLPQPTIMNGNLVLSFTTQPGITYTVEASTDLVTWSAAGVTQQANGSQVTATYPLPPSGTAFLHVVVGPSP